MTNYGANEKLTEELKVMRGKIWNTVENMSLKEKRHE